MKRKKHQPARDVREYLAEIGRRGGTTSRRELTKTQARQMVAIREARRAARKAGVSPAEIDSWRFTIDPARPPAHRRSPQIKRRDFPTYAKVLRAS